ncbi:hypothetical protein [Halpernia frigidisoli]|uniref:Uncharacterized protein n=1 Tax=Halpernia frigidisoli TaxID=1125876 RepID=A0A1I3FIL5_9FLAO|nr:hypothetical protein [Halpernia frigidisoli]SFI11007.1 hypothetical protein SAMN05443292_1405 [Halpernia frigidisoli]
MTVPSLSEVKSLLNQPIKKGYFFVGLKLKEIKGLRTDEISNLLSDPNNNDFSVNNYHKEIEHEKKRLCNEMEVFYNDPFIVETFCKDGLSMTNIFEQTKKKMIQVERMNLLLEPKITESILKKKPYDVEYLRARIVWLDDDGKKNLNNTKIFGRSGEMNSLLLLEKMVRERMNGKNIISEVDVKTKDGKFSADLIAEIDGEQWVFEAKITSRKEYIIDSVRFHLWELYKKTYLI